MATANAIEVRENEAPTTTSRTVFVGEHIGYAIVHAGEVILGYMVQS